MSKLVDILTTNGIAVMATDTLYGIVGSATSNTVVDRIYEIKGRDENKPFIILISSIDSLLDFGITLSDSERSFLVRVWPGPVTVIIPLPLFTQERFTYLHRGTNTLAFRLPDDAGPRLLLIESGPLVAPSANPQGKPPATTIDEARSYFGSTVDQYEDGGIVQGEPSTIVRLEKGEVTVIRQGAFHIV